MYIGSQIINQFHGRIEKNKCSNVIRQHQAAVLSVFPAAFYQQPVPPLLLSPYLTGLINHSAGYWKLCRLTSLLRSSQLCLPTDRSSHVCRTTADRRGLSREWGSYSIFITTFLAMTKTRHETKRLFPDPGWKFKNVSLSLEKSRVTCAPVLYMRRWTYEPC